MRFHLLLALLCLPVVALSQTVHPAGVSGCIAHWTFASGISGVLVDSSNNGHNGISYSLTAVNGYKNRPGQAMRFNGSSSYAKVPTDNQLNPSSISIVALVRLNGLYSGNCQANNIIYKSYSYFQPGCWAMMVDESSYDNSCSTFSPSFEQMQFISPTTAAPTIPSGNYIQTGDWYLFVSTYDGDSLKRYQVIMDTTNWLTGIQPISKSKIGVALGANTEDVYIGATQNSSFPFWFNGDMDDIALFNRPLADTEVQMIYNYFRGPKPTPAGLANSNKSAMGLLASANGRLCISNPAQGKSFSVTVFDIAGRRIYSGVSSENIQIDVHDYAHQLLLVRIQNEEGVWTGKLWAY